ncbi:hypothetical protein ROT00_04145 [Agromyces mediolanus]|uniref:hypothetical protein n=1 Tax=Agromyces mediolanus TaxID=41986 RepID=UPI003833978B
MPRSHRSRVVAAALALGLAAALAGCDSGAGTAPSPSQPSMPPPDEPIFASDEEALAAAEDAYAAYAAASAAVGADGGVGVERLRDLVDVELYKQSVEEFRQFEEMGLSSEGTSIIRNAALADHRALNDQVLISAYLCRDVSNVRVLDRTGDDVTPADRQDRQSLLVSFKGTRGHLVISQIEPWKDQTPCE